jgi:hypothetical protein
VAAALGSCKGLRGDDPTASNELSSTVSRRR